MAAVPFHQVALPFAPTRRSLSHCIAPCVCHTAAVCKMGNTLSSSCRSTSCWLCSGPHLGPLPCGIPMEQVRPSGAARTTRDRCCPSRSSPLNWRSSPCQTARCPHAGVPQNEGFLVPRGAVVALVVTVVLGLWPPNFEQRLNLCYHVASRRASGRRLRIFHLVRGSGRQKKPPRALGEGPAQLPWWSSDHQPPSRAP